MITDIELEKRIAALSDEEIASQCRKALLELEDERLIKVYAYFRDVAEGAEYLKLNEENLDWCKDEIESSISELKRLLRIIEAKRRLLGKERPQ